MDLLFHVLLVDFLERFYLFLERREGREKERDRNICWLCLLHAPSRDLTLNPGTCLDQELSH